MQDEKEKTQENVQENELSVWGLTSIIARRGTIITVMAVILSLAVTVAGILWNELLLERKDHAIEQAKRDAEIAKCRAEIVVCKEAYALKIEELKDNQIEILERTSDILQKQNHIENTVRKLPKRR